VPSAPSLNSATSSGALSTSVSFASTSTSTETPASVIASSSTATGASLTALTLMVTVFSSLSGLSQLALGRPQSSGSPRSVSFTLKLSGPEWFGSGV
jgi:hypothetical protein